MKPLGVMSIGLSCVVLNPVGALALLVAEEHAGPVGADAGQAPQSRIQTVAGSGPACWKSSGDGRRADQAQIVGVWSLAVDRAGSVFLGDTFATRIRKVDKRGIITTIAGERRGFKGDGGPATAARINEPCGIAFDASGNLYFTDNDNWRIRKIDRHGIISTVAGNGECGFSGDGGPALKAALSYPLGIAVDRAGGIYFSDSGNQRIRKIDARGVISTIAGSGKAGFSGDGGPALKAEFNSPFGLVFDRRGNLYVADQRNCRVRRITPAGIVTTVAGTGKERCDGDGGPADKAGIAWPIALAIESDNLYVSTPLGCVRRISAAGTIMTLAGNHTNAFAGDGGPAAAACFGPIMALAADRKGNLYLGDSDNRRVRKIDRSGRVTSFVGTGTTNDWSGTFAGDGGPATQARFNGPWGVAVDRQGNLYIADQDNHRVRKVTPDAKITTVVGNGTAGFAGDEGPASQAQLNGVLGICLDRAGNLLIADAANNRIRKIATDGSISTIAGTGSAGFAGDGGPAVAAQLMYPFDVAVDKSGNCYIADGLNSRVRMVSTNGIITTVAGGGEFSEDQSDGQPATKAKLHRPSSVFVDDQGSLYFTDLFMNRVRKVSPDGIITTIAGTGKDKDFAGDGGPAIHAILSNPTSVVVDAAGTVFISDRINSCVRKVTPDGVIRTIAGLGDSEAGLEGDGGPAAKAKLGGPTGLALDSQGNLYVADTWNNRVRKITGVAAVGTLLK